MAKTKDLTKGNIGTTLIFYAIPLLLGSLIQQLYNTVDLIFVGNMINKTASSAIGASSLLITCLVGFFGGMSVGSGVVVSHIFGARDLPRLDKAVHNAVALSLAGGALLMVFGFFFAPFYLKIVNTPAELQSVATAYLRIYFLSFPAMFVYNIGSGVLRALGNSRYPLYAQFFGGLVNVLMDFVLIRTMSNGVNGVALATTFSQTMAAALTLIFLAGLDPAYGFRWRKIGFDRALLKNTIAIGVPAGAQSLVITLSNVFAQYHINSFGADAIAAFTAYFKVELVIYLPIVAFGQAMMAFAGQNFGAKDYERVRKGTRICLLISMALAAVSSVLALRFGHALFRVFNREEEVIGVGLRLIGVTFPFYCIYCVLQILGDSLRGCGRVSQPMIIILVNICVIRTTLLYILVPRIRMVEAVAVTYPVTWALTGICMAAYYGWYWRGLNRGLSTGASSGA